MRVFIKHQKGTSEAVYTKLFKTIRNAETNEVQVFLPEKNEIVSTGWVPEISYQMKKENDVLDVFIKPELSVLLRSLNNVGQDTEKPFKEPDFHLLDTSGEKEKSGASAGKGATVLYEVTFCDREIKVNGLKLSKPHFNSVNELVFDYLFRNPNKRIELKVIEKAIDRPINKRLQDIVRDLGFRGSLRSMFFPNVAKTVIEFVNPITKEELDSRALEVPNITVVAKKRNVEKE